MPALQAFGTCMGCRLAVFHQITIVNVIADVQADIQQALCHVFWLWLMLVKCKILQAAQVLNRYAQCCL